MGNLGRSMFFVKIYFVHVKDRGKFGGVRKVNISGLKNSKFWRQSWRERLNFGNFGSFDPTVFDGPWDKCVAKYVKGQKETTLKDYSSIYVIARSQIELNRDSETFPRNVRSFENERTSQGMELRENSMKIIVTRKTIESKKK